MASIEYITKRIEGKKAAKEMKMNKPNVNAYWEYVKSIYPDARFDFWYHNGELHFYKDAEMEKNGYTYGCIKKDGKFEILTEF